MLCVMVTKRTRLVCFNNFYYCRYFTISELTDGGQYASIISTIVDYSAMFMLILWLVCFNNFYYCRYRAPLFGEVRRLVCFNNFYYCRCISVSESIKLWLVCFNNFYYCRSMSHHRHLLGQYASIISTIVDEGINTLL